MTPADQLAAARQLTLDYADMVAKLMRDKPADDPMWEDVQKLAARNWTQAERRKVDRRASAVEATLDESRREARFMSPMLRIFIAVTLGSLCLSMAAARVDNWLRSAQFLVMAIGWLFYAGWRAADMVRSVGNDRKSRHS